MNSEKPTIGTVVGKDATNDALLSKNSATNRKGNKPIKSLLKGSNTKLESYSNGLKYICIYLYERNHEIKSTMP